MMLYNGMFILYKNSRSHFGSRFNLGRCKTHVYLSCTIILYDRHAQSYVSCTRTRVIYVGLEASSPIAFLCFVQCAWRVVDAINAIAYDVPLHGRMSTACALVASLLLIMLVACTWPYLVVAL